MTRYWINTVSRDHVRAGVEGDFTQANHGRSTALGRLAQGDLIAFYSPRTAYTDGPPLRSFTAIGRITDAQPYQAEVSPSFHPWRRRVAFLPCAETPIAGLIERLDFISDKRRWGFVFRRGLFEIGGTDFERIATAMQADIGPT